MESTGNKFSLKFREEYWMVSEESSKEICGLLDCLFIDNMSRKTKDDFVSTSLLFNFLNHRKMEVRGDEIWMIGDGENDKPLEYHLRELSIVLEIKKDRDKENKYLLVDNGKIIKEDSDYDSLLSEYVVERTTDCGYCGNKGVRVQRLKNAESYLVRQARALMCTPKQYEKKYILEVCPCCGYAHRDISIVPTAEEKEVIKRGYENVNSISEAAPTTVKKLYEYACLSLYNRDYNQSLLCFLYAYEYYHLDYNMLDRLVTTRCALEYTIYDEIKESNLLRLDILRRGEQNPHEYDSFDFSGEFDNRDKWDGARRQIEAEYLLDLCRKGDKRKRTDIDFEKAHPESSAEEYYVFFEEPVQKIGHKTIKLKSEYLKEADRVSIGDFISINDSDRSELVCKVTNIEEEIGLFKHASKSQASDKKTGQERMMIFTLEILKEQEL